MARVKYGQGVADIRGSVGGTVFSRNANGAYMRNRTTPFNSNTISQQLVRAQFGNISRAWRDLTQAEQESFINQSPNYPYTNSLGESSVYTGFQLFQKTNTQLEAIGLPSISSMPSPVELPSITALSIDNLLATTVEIDVTFSDGLKVVPANTRLIIMATRPLSFGINKPKRPDFKSLTVKVAAADVDSFDITPFYTTVYQSPLVAGDYIFIRCMLVSAITGQTSNPVDVSGVLT